MLRILERAQMIYGWFDADNTWRIQYQPPEVQKRLRDKYKAAGKIARLVTAARDRAVTHTMAEAEKAAYAEFRTGEYRSSLGDYYVYRCVTEIFLPTLNRWRKERVRYFSWTKSYKNLASHAKAVIRRSGNSNRGFVAHQEACYHACMVVHHAHEAIFALVIGKDPTEATSQALEELAQVNYYAMCSEYKKVDLDEIREKLKQRFTF